MRRLMLGGLTALMVVMAMVALAARVSAHALAQSSVPADGDALQKSPSVISITFGETPDPRLSSIEVLSTSGQQYQVGPVQPQPGNAVILNEQVKPLPKGVYTVSWITVSAVDGHRAGGTFDFGVGVDPSQVPIGVGSSGVVTGGAGNPGPADIIGRLLLYVGLVALVGGASTATMVLPRPDRRVVRTLPVAWLAAAGGIATVVAAQAVNAGAGFGQIFSTSIGRALLERAVPLAVAGLALPVCLRAVDGRRRTAVTVAGSAGALAMLGDVLNSHAAAGQAVAATVAVQWIHILAVGVWIGGLLALLLALRGMEGEVRGRAVRRFSSVALVAYIAVAATGVIRAVVEIGAWDKVLTTSFGKLVVVKAALLVVIGVLAAVNRFRNVPVASRVVRGLRRVGTAEVIVALAVLLAAASLVNQTPPNTIAAVVPPPEIVQNANDYGTTVKMQLTIQPGYPGVNRFTAKLTDYDTGAPLSVGGVSLTFTDQSRPDLGSSTLNLKPSTKGTYIATGGNLALQGTWQINALIARGDNSVEIPFTVTTKTKPQTVKVTPGGGGIPTLYTVSLSDGNALQVYIDPQKAGSVEFHMTYFDGSGNGIAAVVTSVKETPAGGRSRTLAFRFFGPGHYIADATVAKGSNGFDVVATSPQGDTMTAHIDITVK